MNYIDVINRFWDSVILNPLSTGQVALWFALLHINNRCNWTEWFTVPNQVLSIHSGLSRSGILKARNELKQRGLIDFKERGTLATSYKITIAKSKQDSMQDSVQDSVRNGVQDGTQNSNTLNKHKLKQKLKPKSIDKSIPEMYVENEELNHALVAFMDFRKGIKAPMSNHAVNLMIKRLDGMAEDYVIKIAILEQSIMNGWKGVFPLKEPQTQEKKPQAKNAFHNFNQRDTDYDAIMLQQLKDRS